MAPTVLAGRYELQHKLGSGGMATVYQAHDGLLDRAVAVKLLRTDSLAEATARQRFAAEARAAASLTHPHAVAVYDVSSSDEQPFIVMELVRGSTLEDVLQDEQQLTDDQVIAVGSQVLTALHAAHRRGLVHRDVKPANILLPGGIVPTRPEELPGVKLADFGIAKAATDATVGLTVVGQVIGTPKYLSPEQVKGERATPQSDLYATAVVLYEMLAGRAPFERDTALAMALAHREDEPPPLSELRPDLNPNVVALVHRTLSKDPANRPADANEMREALITAASAPPGTQLLGAAAASTELIPPGSPVGPTEPVAPAPLAPAPPAPAPEPPRRRGGWFVLLAVLVILGVAAALWLANRATNTELPTGEEQSAPADEQQEQTEAPQGGANEPDANQEQQDGNSGSDGDQGQSGTDEGQSGSGTDQGGSQPTEEADEGSGGGDPQDEDPPVEDEDPAEEEPPPEEEPVEEPTG